jgi:hypothetical protein
MIDRHDAPDGMVAVRCKEPPCEGCFFENKKEDCPYDNPEEMRCDWLFRPDDEDVIFKTRADFEKMLLQEIEQFYGNGKVKRIIFTKDNIK